VAFHSALVLRKHTVGYFRCPSCGFVQTEPPYWLDEAYSSALSSYDTGVMQRNLRNARVTASVIALLFPEAKGFLDYGGGHGTFVRLMRDLGFNFRWSDKYANNLHAQGFDHVAGEHYDLATAFELLEHLTDPIGELSAILRYADNLLTTTILLPEPAPSPAEWWYYSVESGQHISFYTSAALKKTAKRLGVHVISNGEFHLWSRVPRNSVAFRAAANPWLAQIISRICRRKSLTESDFELLSGRVLR